jgi:hypothetical protein
MAITRCPYCHAIIDETDKYCNNCGTQLLFPDEDAIEEEIPGEKIIDAETEEKDYELDEPGKSIPGGFVDEDEREEESVEVKTSELDEALEGEPPDRNIRELIEEEEPAEGPGEGDELEDVILVDEIAAHEAGAPADEEEELIVKPEPHPPTTAVIEDAAETGPTAETEVPQTEAGSLEAEAEVEPAAPATTPAEAEPPEAEAPAEPFRLTSDEPQTAAPAAPPSREAPQEKDEETRAYLIDPIPLDEHDLESDEDESPVDLPGDEETAEIAGDEAVQDESEAGVVCEGPAEEEERTGEILPAEPEVEETRVEPVAEEAHAEPAEPVREPTPVAWREPTPPPMREAEPEPEEERPEGEPAGAEPLSKPITFDTGELEGIGKTIDLSKARLDSLIEEMVEEQEVEEKQAVCEPEPAQAAEEEPSVAADSLREEEVLPPVETKPFREPEEEPAPEAEPVPKTGTLPPWASRMKGRPTIPDTGETGEELSPFEEAKKSVGAFGPTPGLPEEAPAKDETPDAEVEIFPRQRMPDSGIGLPERITQGALPFAETSSAAEEGARPLDEDVEEALGTEEIEVEMSEEPVEEPAVEAPVRPAAPPVPPPPPQREAVSAPVREQVPAEAVEEEPRPPFSLSLFAKSKGFDLLLVGAFWLVAMWVAARSLGSTLFEMLGSSPTALVGLYGILVGLYFFLFKFFLGETLGDRLFREREPADD